MRIGFLVMFDKSDDSTARDIEWTRQSMLEELRVWRHDPDLTVTLYSLNGKDSNAASDGN